MYLHLAPYSYVYKVSGGFRMDVTSNLFESDYEFAEWFSMNYNSKAYELLKYKRGVSLEIEIPIDSKK